LIGTPAGLPDNIPLIPEILRKYDYSTAMVGKWHLGHGQMKQTPTGRGFQQFLGNYMWDIDSYTKQMYEDPMSPALMIDWIRSYENGSYHHYAEARHAMTAIHDEAIQIIQKHSQEKNPLFLYLSYTSAHSPLQPLAHHMVACQHIVHEWRREFCGMVQAIDESVGAIIHTAMQSLDPASTYVILSSDNGGSPWFGGGAYPYRGSKGTAFEGGVKVPGLILPLSSLAQTSDSSSTTLSDRYQGIRLNRKYPHLFHASDWLPTLLSLAQIDPSSEVTGLDGIDLSASILAALNEASPETSSDLVLRREMLVEMYEAEDSVFQQDLFAYRMQDMKLIQGSSYRDEHYYYPSSSDSLNSSVYTKLAASRYHDRLSWKYSLVTFLNERLIRYLSLALDVGRFDGLRIFMTHSLTQGYYATLPSLYFQNPLLINYTGPNRGTAASKTRLHKIYLFNLTADPYEEHNLAWDYPELVATIQQRLHKIRDHAPPQPKVWYQYHLTKEWVKTHVIGDCSMNPSIKDAKDCRFTHPWIDDKDDPWKDMDKLVDGRLAAMDRLHEKMKQILAVLVILVLTIKIISFQLR
jgi:hypothetical protein